MSRRPATPRARAAVALALAAGLVAGCADRAERLPAGLESRGRHERASAPEAAAETTTTASTTTSSTEPPTTTTTAPFDVHALRPPPPPGDPASLAAQIVQAETVLRDPAAGPEAVGIAALAQQVAYRTLGDHPEWDDAVLAAVPPELHAAVTGHAAARRSFGAMHRRLPTTLPAWRIVPPAPLEELHALYLEAEATFGVPWPYLAAINLVETGMGRIRGTSVAGAQGPMQFMPATWEAYGGGGDINSVRDSILAAGRYLAANGGAARIANALWNYNHSNHYVHGVMRYADLIAEHPGSLRALYHWGVFYRTHHGDVYLPVGYDEPTPIPAP